MTPPGFDRTKKSPVFVVIHGGPHSGVVNAMQFRWNAQVFSRWDCVVLQPHCHGSSGFGETFTDRHSPHLSADNFRTPTLVIHGQCDDLRLLVNHGIELFQTLLVKGVPTRLVYFPDENHGVLKTQNSLFWYPEVKRWLDLHNPPPQQGAGAVLIQLMPGCRFRGHTECNQPGAAP